MSKNKLLNIIKSIFTSFWTYWTLFIGISYIIGYATLEQAVIVGLFPFMFIFILYFIGIMLFILSRPFSDY